MKNWIENIKWTEDGLVPVVVQDHISNKVIMFAWMNRLSLEASIKQKKAIYWSRSRKKIWTKGESSGYYQHIKDMIIDCDKDVLLIKVIQEGGISCHTGTSNGGHYYAYCKNLNNNWHIFNNSASLSKKLAQEILKIAKKSIQKKDTFNIVLTGGQSALGLYRIFSKANSNWSKWHIYITDERLLPEGHQDRNDRLINEIWLKNSAISKKNIHFIPAEIGLLEAQKKYEEELRSVNKFDVVLLSVGEDGHISSLFPGHTYSNNQYVVIEENSPKPPAQRISMSYNRMKASENIFIIIMGKLKQEAVQSIIDKKNIPVNKIINGTERLFVHRNTMENNNLNFKNT